MLKLYERNYGWIIESCSRKLSEVRITFNFNHSPIGRGVEDMEFLGVLKKKHVENPGVNKKGSGNSRGVQEKLMWNFHGS